VLPTEDPQAIPNKLNSKRLTARKAGVKRFTGIVMALTSLLSTAPLISPLQPNADQA
jgi:hypothetical protein